MDIQPATSQAPRNTRPPAIARNSRNSRFFQGFKRLESRVVTGLNTNFIPIIPDEEGALKVLSYMEFLKSGPISTKYSG